MQLRRKSLTKDTGPVLTFWQMCCGLKIVDRLICLREGGTREMSCLAAGWKKTPVPGPLCPQLHIWSIFFGDRVLQLYLPVYSRKRTSQDLQIKNFSFLSFLISVCVIHLGALYFGQGQAKTLLLIWLKIFTSSGPGIISDAGDQKPLVVRSKLYFPVFVSLSCTPVGYKRNIKGFVKSRIIFYIARQSMPFAIHDNCHSKIILHFEMSTFLSNISLLFSVSHCTGREVQSII